MKDFMTLVSDVPETSQSRELAERIALFDFEDGNNPVNIAFEVDAGFDTSFISSPSHKIEVHKSGKSRFKVVPSQTILPGEQDFVLEWQLPKTQEVVSFVHTEELDGEYFTNLVIVTPLEGSPALRSGVMAGDRVTEIDGEGIFGKSTDECIELLQGEPGTTVVITVERAGETIEIPIERARIQTLAVKGFHRASDEWQYVIDPARRIAYVRLTQFTPGCADEVRAALEGAMEEGSVGGLVLDLRWNPGGLLSEAGAIADLFLESGVIVSTRGRSVPEEVREARSAGTLAPFPIAVLVNGGSASASEVLAGALQDNGRAVVVGTRTFGKGSVQSVRPLPRGGGAQLKVTEQRYYLPSGRSIHRLPGESVWGVDPDEGFWVEMTNEQTRAMLEVRRAEEIIDGRDQGSGVDWRDTDVVLGYLSDPQLEAAVRAVQGRVDTGRWTATGEAGIAGNELAAEELARLRLTRERVLRELTRLDARLDSLETASAGADAEVLRDLWPDDAVIEGGRVEVVDAEGRVLRTLRITGPDLERWLIDADVEVGDGDVVDEDGE